MHYEYDENFPYVAENDLGFAVARFAHEKHVTAYLPNCRVIDTTPKPRVPADAKWIFWIDSSAERHVAWNGEGASRKWMEVGSFTALPLEDLPGVTPDTVFTVLDAREEQS